MIAALFVQSGGCYFGLDNVDPWDEARDARLYAGPWPVVAHPPCQRYGRLGYANYIRWGGEHNRPGNDGGCFAAALSCVNLYGGVLEHPAGSMAWPLYGIERPEKGRWTRSGKGWVCEVWQSAYGHRANKKTWLYFCGPAAPMDMRWDRPIGSHQVGFQDRRGKSKNKPTLSRREANATPALFRDALISLAVSAGRGEG